MRLELIIFFIFLASAIVLFAWKKREKEVEEPQEKKPGGPQPPSPNRKKIRLANGVGLAIIILAAVIIYKMAGVGWFQPTRAAMVDYPLCADSKRWTVKDVGDRVVVNLYSNCWSGWVSLPERVRWRVRTLSPGDLEYKFWDGKRILVPDGAASYNVAKNIPESVFRLRGNGQATVTAEKL